LEAKPLKTRDLRSGWHLIGAAVLLAAKALGPADLLSLLLRGPCAGALAEDLLEEGLDHLWQWAAHRMLQRGFDILHGRLGA